MAYGHVYGSAFYGSPRTLRRVVGDKLGHAPNTYAENTSLGSAGAPHWGIPPGRSAPTVNAQNDGMPFAACSRDANGAAYWAEGDFHADQFAQIAHGPPAWPTLRKSVGIVVRQADTTDSCYVAYPIYLGDVDGPGGTFNLVVQRIINGVPTTLATVGRPNFTFFDDHWFIRMEAWGQNPVRLRVISMAPAEYVLGTGQANDPPEAVPNHGSRYLINGVEESHLLGTYYFTPTLQPLGSLTAPTEDPVSYLAADAESHRAYVLWEYADTNAARLTLGRPGFRFGNDIQSNPPQLGFSGAHFSAGELRLTGRFATGIVEGERQPGSTVSLSSASVTLGAVTYPTASTWQATASGVEVGDSIDAVATDSGGQALEAITVTNAPDPVVVAPPTAALSIFAAAPAVSTATWRVDVAPPSAALSLSADAPTVELVDASPLSLPAWVWNGTEYVRASFHLLG